MVKGQVTKITTTKDQCTRIVVDVENGFIPEGVNLLKWQDQMVTVCVTDEEANDGNNGGQ
jgi:hypothetical protein